MRLGGLGLQNPVHTRAVSHLGSLERLPESFRGERWEAEYQKRLRDAAEHVGNNSGSTIEATITQVKEIRERGAQPMKELTSNIHKVRKAILMRNASHQDQRRLESVSQSHAIAFTLGPGIAKPLTSAQMKAGLLFVLGEKVMDQPTQCQCGMLADVKGSHFASCQRYDKRMFRHNQWRDTCASAVRMAGMAVQIEMGTSETRQRPGDIAIDGWRDGKQIAVDFGITSQQDPTAPDRMAQAKHALYDDLCSRHGKDFVAVIGDSYGAVRGEGGKFLTSLSKKIHEKHKGRSSYPTVLDLFWRGMSTCIIRRAAGAIAAAWEDGMLPTMDTNEDFVFNTTSTDGIAGNSSAEPHAISTENMEM